MTLSAETVEAEVLKDLFESIGKATDVAKDPGRALEIASEKSSETASRDPRVALAATLDLIKIAITAEGTKVVRD